jgi:hypothetical protein
MSDSRPEMESEVDPDLPRKHNKTQTPLDLAIKNSVFRFDICHIVEQRRRGVDLISFFIELIDSKTIWLIGKYNFTDYRVINLEDYIAICKKHRVDSLEYCFDSAAWNSGEFPDDECQRCSRK